MNKGLEAFEILKQDIGKCYEDEMLIVEKELKEGEKNKRVLEIIKKSICDIRVNYWGDLDRYTMSLNHCSRDITKEEYDLLREELL